MPVINPWVFYAVYVADSIVVVASVVAVVVGIGYLIIKAISIAVLCEEGADDEGYIKVKNIAKHLGRIALVAIILSTIVPSEKTVTKMIVAQNVTYERVEAATDVVQTVSEDIMSLFKEEESE